MNTDKLEYIIASEMQRAKLHPEEPHWNLDFLEQASKEVEQFATLQEAYNNFALQVFVIAVKARADAAIVAKQDFNETHSLQALKELVEYTEELRNKNEAYGKYFRTIAGKR